MIERRKKKESRNKEKEEQLVIEESGNPEPFERERLAAADARSMSLGDQRPLEEGCLALKKCMFARWCVYTSPFALTWHVATHTHTPTCKGAFLLGSHRTQQGMLSPKCGCVCEETNSLSLSFSWKGDSNIENCCNPDVYNHLFFPFSIFRNFGVNFLIFFL